MTSATGRASALVAIAVWSVALASALLFPAVSAFFIVQQPDLWLEALWPVSWLGFPIVGAVIVSSRPRHLVGRLLLTIGVCVAVGLFGSIYAETAIAGEPWSLPGARWALWISQVFLIPSLGLVAFLLLVFPSGKLPSARWRRPVQAAIAAQVVLVFAFLTRDVLVAGEGKRLPNPAAIGPIAPAMNAIIGPLVAGLLIFGLVALANLVWRFARSRGVERQQLKWLVFSAAAFPVLFATGVVTADIFVIAAFVLGLNGIAVSIGLAVLRFRLYDIDRVISRTLSYAIVTAVLGGTFATIALGPALVVGRGGTGAPDYVIAVATLVVAALFRPVRRRVQSAVDHRFDRRRYDAEHTIEAFTTRLREQTDIDDLGAELRGVVGRTMQPEHVSLWLAARPKT